MLLVAVEGDVVEVGGGEVCLNAPGALPGLAFMVKDKAEVAFVATLTESLRADEINVVQIAVIDDIAVAEHMSEAFKQAVFFKDYGGRGTPVSRNGNSPWGRRDATHISNPHRSRT